MKAALFLCALLVLPVACFGQYDLNIWEIASNGSAGTGTLIRGSNGTVVLYDEGGGGPFASYLKSLLDSEGISYIHYAIAGHYDQDHIGGLDDLVNMMGGTSAFGTFYDRGGTVDHDGNLIASQYSSVVFPSGKRATPTLGPSGAIDLGNGATLTFLSRGATDTTPIIYVHGRPNVTTGITENNKSITALLTYNGFDMYIGSDAEGTNEKAVDDVIVYDLIRDVDVTLVDHHGSDTYGINSYEFFQNINPEVALISCWNVHGHPRRTTVENIQPFVDTSPGSQKILRIHPGDENHISWAPEDMDGCFTTNGHIKISTDGNFYTVTSYGDELTDSDLTDHLVDQGGGADSDADGLSDSYENTTPYAYSEVDWDGVPGVDYYTNPADDDTDDDGLKDGVEALSFGTNPLDPDSDDDGFTDGPERTYWGANWNTNYDGDGITNNLLDPDSDNDGLLDGEEYYTYNTNPGQQDSDSDGFRDDWEVANGFNPNDPQDLPAIVINEVLYDPVGYGDQYYEFVELFNPHNRNIDIGFFHIQSAGASFSTTYTIPEGTSIPAHSYFLIGGSSVTDINGYSPDLTASNLGLQNGDYTYQQGGYMVSSPTDGVRFVSPLGGVLDTVLYDVPNDNDLPGDDADPGLELVPDTDDNSGWSIGRIDTGYDSNDADDWTHEYNPTPACSVYARADFDLDGDVDEDDRAILLADWGTGTVLTDINFDGRVDDLDLGFFIGEMTDPWMDYDSDGVSDQDEVNYDGDPGYDPYDPNTNPTGTDPDVNKADTDGDGYSDYIEMGSGSSPVNPGETPPAVRVNFQPAESSIPAGYLPDSAVSRDPKGYGW